MNRVLQLVQRLDRGQSFELSLFLVARSVQGDSVINFGANHHVPDERERHPYP